MIFNQQRSVSITKWTAFTVFCCSLISFVGCSWKEHYLRYLDKSPKWNVDNKEARITEHAIDTLETTCNLVHYYHPWNGKTMIEIMQCENGYSYSKWYWRNGSIYFKRTDYRLVQLEKLNQFPFQASILHDKKGRPLGYNYWENRGDTNIDYYQLYDRDGNLVSVKYQQVYSILGDLEESD